MLGHAGASHRILPEWILAEATQGWPLVTRDKWALGKTG